MPKLIVTKRDGETRTLDAELGVSAMEAIRDSGINDIVALCGGVCSCATCHVHVDPEFAQRLPPLSEDEDALLEGSQWRDERSRLSCQIRMSDSLSGLRVTIAQED
jgi:ferredoxin, 2Fe-2S